MAWLPRSFKRPVGLAGWGLLLFWLVVWLLDWWDRGQSALSKLRLVAPFMPAIVDVLTSPWFQVSLLVVGLALIALASRPRTSPQPADSQAHPAATRVALPPTGGGELDQRVQAAIAVLDPDCLYVMKREMEKVLFGPFPSGRGAYGSLSWPHVHAKVDKLQSLGIVAMSTEKESFGRYRWTPFGYAVMGALPELRSERKSLEQQVATLQGRLAEIQANLPAVQIVVDATASGDYDLVIKNTGAAGDFRAEIQSLRAERFPGIPRDNVYPGLWDQLNANEVHVASGEQARLHVASVRAHPAQMRAIVLHIFDPSRQGAGELVSPWSGASADDGTGPALDFVVRVITRPPLRDPQISYAYRLTVAGLDPQGTMLG